MIIVTYAVVLSFESLWGIRLLPLLSIDRANRHTHTWFSNTGNFHYRWIRCTVSVGKIVYGVCVYDQYCLILIPVDIVEGWIAADTYMLLSQFAGCYFPSFWDSYLEISSSVEHSTSNDIQNHRSPKCFKQNTSKFLISIFLTVCQMSLASVDDDQVFVMFGILWFYPSWKLYSQHHVRCGIYAKIFCFVISMFIWFCE